MELYSGAGENFSVENGTDKMVKKLKSTQHGLTKHVRGLISRTLYQIRLVYTVKITYAFDMIRWARITVWYSHLCKSHAIE